jgi:hypothetical protein
VEILGTYMAISKGSREAKKNLLSLMFKLDVTHISERDLTLSRSDRTMIYALKCKLGLRCPIDTHEAHYQCKCKYCLSD